MSNDNVTNDMQTIANLYFAIRRGDKNLVPANVTLAAITRTTTPTIRIMIPPDVSEVDLQSLAQYLYEWADGGEFTVDDTDFFEEGTHTIEYVSQQKGGT